MGAGNLSSTPPQEKEKTVRRGNGNGRDAPPMTTSAGGLFSLLAHLMPPRHPAADRRVSSVRSVLTHVLRMPRNGAMSKRTLRICINNFRSERQGWRNGG